MKKNSFLKALVIVFLVYVVLSWIIPVGYFSSGKLVTDATSPVGIFDLILYPIIAGTSSVFLLTAIVILLMGGLYGVLNKTGAYSKITEGIAKKFKGKEKRVLVFITLFFVILTSFTGLTLPMFMLVPFMATVLMLLGYSKFTSCLSTIGGILIGNLASTYGFNVAGYISYLTENINDSIIFRVLLLVVVSGVLIYTLLKTSKINKKKEENIPLYEKNIDKNANTKPIVILSIISFILVLVGMINWNAVFGIELFENIHKSITEFEIGGYTLFGNLIGTLPAIGSWTNYELALILIILSFVIGKIYKMKFNEILDGMVDGMKEVVPVALVAIIANIIFLLMNSNTSGYTIFAPISNYLLNLTKNLNVVTMSITSIIGSIFYNDFPYMLSSMYSPITTLYESYSVIGFIAQSMHGLVQLVAPTSVVLVAGLTLFNIDYKEWLKNLWKLFILLLLAILVIIIIMSII